MPMLHAVRERVIVQPDGTIEIRSPELPPPGTCADVVVVFDLSEEEEPGPPLTSLLGATRGQFASPEEADAYLKGEREW